MLLRTTHRAENYSHLKLALSSHKSAPHPATETLADFSLKFISAGILSFYTTSTPRIAHYFAMGTGKKEANRKIRQGKVGDGMANVKVKGENFYRYGRSYLLLP